MKLNTKDIDKILDFVNFLKILNNDYKKFTDIFQFMEKNGFHITKSEFYSPIPEVDKLSKQDFELKELTGVDWNEENQVTLLTNLLKFSKEYEKIIQDGKFDPNNGAFSVHDAPVYFSMIRYLKPKKIMEIGAGFSTILSSEAAKLNKNTKILAIDPYVESSLKKKIPDTVEFIEKPVQEIPLSKFRELEEKDILFIDSSHVSKIGSDVNFLYLEILPRLKKGVVVHIHDIFLPKQYPMEWIKNDHRRFWNEQYLLNAFLIGNSLFEIMLGNSFMNIKYPKLLQNLYNLEEHSSEGSFWIRKLND